MEHDRSIPDDILQKLTLAGDGQTVGKLLRQELQAKAAEEADRTRTVIEVSATSGGTGHALATNPVNFRTPNAYLVTRRIQLRDTFTIFFRMKTIQEDCLILFAAGGSLWQSSSSVYASSFTAVDDARGVDFIAVELVRGKLHYVFNVTGVGTPRIIRSKSQPSINDNRWHEISIMRPRLSEHIIRVDDMARSDNAPDATEFDLSSEAGRPRAAVADDSGDPDDRSSTVLFFGGVPMEMYDLLPRPIRSRHGFQGCIASVDLNGDTDGLLKMAEVPPEHQHYIGSECQGMRAGSVGDAWNY